MKYKKLPFQAELEAILQNDGADKLEEVRAAAFSETARTKGFQLVTALLRDLESAVIGALRTGSHPRVERLMGRLELIEEIRRVLTVLLPVPERAQVDWFDEEEDSLYPQTESKTG